MNPPLFPEGLIDPSPDVTWPGAGADRVALALVWAQKFGFVAGRYSSDGPVPSGSVGGWARDPWFYPLKDPSKIAEAVAEGALIMGVIRDDQTVRRLCLDEVAYAIRDVPEVTHVLQRAGDAAVPTARLVVTSNREPVSPKTWNVADLEAAVIETRGTAARESQVITAKRAFKASLLADLALRQSDLELLEQAAAADSVRKVLDGDETPVDVKREQRIARQREKIAAIEAALPVAEQRVVAATVAHEEAEQSYRDAVLALCSALQVTEVAALREQLAALAPAAARLIAIDRVIAEIVGAKFSFDPSRHGALLSGDKVARKLLAGLPDRLRPPELATAAVNGQAVEIASNLISQLQGA